MARYLSLPLCTFMFTLGACSPPDSNDGPQDMAQPVMDMADASMADATQPAEDMTRDVGSVDMPLDLSMPDMADTEECVEGSDRALVGDEICREGVAYICNNQQVFFSLERTCSDVPVDIQFTQISARATSEITNVYRIQTEYTIKNLGTEAALNVMCESQFDDEQGVSGWIDNIGFDTFMLGPGEEHVIDGGNSKGMTPETNTGIFTARCTASNEDDIAATLRNEASTTYTY